MIRFCQIRSRIHILNRTCRFYSSDIKPHKWTVQEGDVIILRETLKGNRYLMQLKEGSKFEHQYGCIQHSDVFGKGARDVVKSHLGKGFTVHRPSLEEYVLMSKRMATPCYPKDAHAMIHLLDMNPYSQILEAGTGNGSLTLHMARLVHNNPGHIHTVDIRESHSKHAEKLVASYERGMYRNNVTFWVGNVLDTLQKIAEPVQFDLIALDLVDPWRQLVNEEAEPALEGISEDNVNQLESQKAVGCGVYDRLANDGVLVCYLPNMTQVLKLAQEIRRLGLRLNLERCIEVKYNEWDVKPAKLKWKESLEMKERQKHDPASDEWVCRPSHLPLPHTAFLVKLKKCEFVPI
ncbi:S-adenosyl-L-methionine-dependent methyltransferase [Paraphysoderma sedebokerense]|nr:S-adenosyl-L-methionine-dependent methyltransferase [Paraphysoderma sedebokerense]